MGKKVLLVDDDPVIRVLVSEYLASHGHDVSAIASGEECLSKLKDMTPDIVLLDLIMPTMTGIDVLKNLQTTNNPRDFKVIMLSANTNSDEMLKANNVEVDGYLTKPFEIKDILEAVEESSK